MDSSVSLQHDLRVPPFGVIWIRISDQWPEWICRFLWCTLIQTDLGSLIFIQITPKGMHPGWYWTTDQDLDQPKGSWTSLRTLVFQIKWSITVTPVLLISHEIMLAYKVYVQSDLFLRFELLFSSLLLAQMSQNKMTLAPLHHDQSRRPSNELD